VIRSAAILLALSVIAAVLTHHFHPRAPLWYEVQEPPIEGEVTVADVQSRWQNDVLWIDARSEAAYAAGHIADAILINEQHRDEQVVEHIARIQDNVKPIVVYCDGHACKASHKIRSYFVDHTGNPNVWVLKGGWPAWQQAKL
jgi:rhodanese-related sulfurtransferase